MKALKSELYALPEGGADLARLKGGRCACGHVFFPMQTYGCEVCGRTGEALEPMLLEGRGSLVASARVLLHAGKDRKTPFVVASIRLVDGPVVRTLLAEDRSERLAVGTAMQTCVVEVGRTETDEAIVDLRFTPAN